MPDSYETTLLDGWEDVYKKSQLTMWILLALKEGDKHMSEVKQFISNRSRRTLTADDKSMYRALRRFYDANIITYTHRASEKGPDQKIYTLTDTGARLLRVFLERNIVNVLYEPKLRKLIES